LEWWSERQGFQGLYQSFLGANPGTDSSKNCGTLGSDRAWRAQNCADSRLRLRRPVRPRHPPGPGVAPPTPLVAGIIPGWTTSSQRAGVAAASSDRLGGRLHARHRAS